jgi:hypothetical protein
MRCLGWCALSCLVASLAHAQAPIADRSFEGRVYPAHWARSPLLDHARAAAGVDVAWQRFGVLGRGATVCVIDTGVDLLHRDFLDALGHTRVDWLLDLDRAPRGTDAALEARFGGAVFRGSELDAMIAANDPSLPTDWHGHGTAVASAAAGDDAATSVATPGPFAGVAPLARLVVVRALRRGTPGFADDDIARGVAFCAAVTDTTHAVALLSLGGHDGAHDGTSAIEQTLADHVHAGLAIVVAAGNDGGRAFHAAARVADRDAVRITLRVPSPEGTTDAHVAVAIRGASDVSLIDPNGAHVHVEVAGAHAEGSTAHGRLVLDVTRPGVVDAMIVGDAHTPIVGGDFAIELRGPANADAWIVSSDVGTSIIAPALIGSFVVPGEEVTIPATSDGVIAVGASVSRATLLASDGGLALSADEDTDGRAIFSARGPSASGGLRPDVLAPGAWIIAARSSAVDPSDPEALVHGDASTWSHLAQPNDRLAIAGTSLSAAIVAGALALAYETAPSETERDRDRLALSASRTDAPFLPTRGFGAIDVAAFLAARTSHDGPVTQLAISASRAFTTPGASNLWLAMTARGATGGVPDDGWLTLTRDRVVVAHAPLVAGIARIPVSVGVALPSTIVTWTAATDDGITATASVPVAWTDDGGAAIPSGGGCSIAHRRASYLWLAIALLVVARARARA